MAFSGGKRIEDETSRRIADIAVNIGCREGSDALTVTRLCRELSSDRRVIYNRFRDIDEINMIVSRRCNEELIAKAGEALDTQVSFHDNFIAVIKTAFAYIYERNPNFQHYTAMYDITGGSVRNGFLQFLAKMIEEGKAAGDICAEADSRKAAQNIWVIMTGIGGILAADSSYKYKDALDAMIYGVEAIVSYMKL